MASKADLQATPGVEPQPDPSTKGFIFQQTSEQQGPVAWVGAAQEEHPLLGVPGRPHATAGLILCAFLNCMTS